MSGRQRRAQNGLAGGQPVIRVIAVHEAGHCVARVLTAGSLGWDAAEVIDYIDSGTLPIATAVASRDHMHGLRSQVVSWGRFLSKPMQEFVATQTRTTRTAKTNAPLGANVDLAPLFAEMRASGIDLDGWFRAKSIVAIFGPMAEAKLTEKPFNELWNSLPAKDDTLGLIRAGTLCGMTLEQIVTATTENVYIAEQQIARPEVWHAINALADNIKPGRMSGRKAAAIVVHALAASEEPAGATAELPSQR